MALLSSSYHPSWRRAIEEGTKCYSVKTSVFYYESFHEKTSPNSFASLRRTGQAGVRRGIAKGAAGGGLRSIALQGGARAPRRLVDFVRAIPKISRAYFKSPYRRALYGGIALLGGFFVAHMLTLSFGALGLNDVVAAGFCLLFAEYVTMYYHTRSQMTFTVALVNNFKMGFTYGLFLDALKIAS
ncbi:unnamed protein product [Calypogeia fissa]